MHAAEYFPSPETGRTGKCEREFAGARSLHRDRRRLVLFFLSARAPSEMLLAPVLHFVRPFLRFVWGNHPNETSSDVIAGCNGGFEPSRTGAGVESTAVDRCGRLVRCSRGARPANYPRWEIHRIHGEFDFSEGRQIGNPDLDGGGNRWRAGRADGGRCVVRTSALVARRAVAGVYVVEAGCGRK